MRAREVKLVCLQASTPMCDNVEKISVRQAKINIQHFYGTSLGRDDWLNYHLCGSVSSSLPCKGHSHHALCSFSGSIDLSDPTISILSHLISSSQPGCNARGSPMNNKDMPIPSGLQELTGCLPEARDTYQPNFFMHEAWIRTIAASYLALTCKVYF